MSGYLSGRERRAARELAARAKEPKAVIRSAGYDESFFVSVSRLGLKVTKARIVDNSVSVNLQGQTTKGNGTQYTHNVILPVAENGAVPSDAVRKILVDAQKTIAAHNPAVRTYLQKAQARAAADAHNS